MSNIKKTLYISETVEDLLKKEAYISRRTESSIVEDILLKELSKINYNRENNLLK